MMKLLTGIWHSKNAHAVAVKELGNLPVGAEQQLRY